MRATTPALPSATATQPSSVPAQADARREAARCRAALARRPDDARLHASLAASLVDLEQYGSARAAYEKAISISPAIETLHGYANLLAKTQCHDMAIQAFLSALQLEPDNASAYNQLGMSYQACGQYDEALEAYRQLLARMPGNAVAYNNIASVLQVQGHLDAALENYRHALTSAPYFDYAHFNMGTCLMIMGRHDDALNSFAETIRLNPSHHLAQINLTAMQSKLGMLDATIASCRLALQAHPEWADMQSNLLFCLTHSTDINAADLFAEHRNVGERFEAPWRSTWPQHANARDPDRRLRVGFVSADLNHHAVTNFIAPVLDHLVHADGLELVVYSNNQLNDFVTEQLRAVVPAWHDIQQLSDAALAQKIQADGIDILIDLSGHTGYNRLPAFARKPAPLQLTWIGYPLTTGLQAMDYYLTDRYLSPPGLLDDQFTEKCLRLPATSPFMPAPGAPPVSAAPAASNGHITFGSFNRPNKLSPAVITRWCKLLKALPDSKLVLGAMPSEASGEKIRQEFVQQGIASERLQFFLHTNTLDYLALHGLVDICLDTSPYGGGTTTFHALWMGVPTVTVTGPTMPGRVAACILGHTGLHDFIADNETDFLHKTIALAKRPDYLAALRESMRARINNSALGQPALIAAGLDAALRTIWQRWCGDLPAVSFDADPEQSSLGRRAASMQSLHDVNVEAALLLAIDHHQASRLVEAETLYLAILHSQPGHAIANHNMGLLATQLGFPQEALPYLAAAHLAAPDELQFCSSYARGLQRAGQARQALDLLSASMAGHAADERWQTGLLEIQADIVNASAHPSQQEAEQIVALYQAGDHAQLEAAARDMIARYPQSGFAWSALGTALQIQGKDALQALQMAVELAPDDAQAQCNLGNAWHSAGRHDAALACYHGALALEPDFADAYCNMANMQQELGMTAEALHNYRSALEIDASHAGALGNLAILLATEATVVAAEKIN